MNEEPQFVELYVDLVYVDDTTDGRYADLSDAEIRDVIHAEVTRRHGISGEAFIRSVRSGTVDVECSRSGDLIGLARLLPEGRPAA